MSIAESIFEEAQALSLEKQKLLLNIAKLLHDEAATNDSNPNHLYYGVLADKGPVPSWEEIQQNRREMMGNWPNEDI